MDAHSKYERVRESAQSLCAKARALHQRAYVACKTAQWLRHSQPGEIPHILPRSPRHEGEEHYQTTTKPRPTTEAIRPVTEDLREIVKRLHASAGEPLPNLAHDTLRRLKERIRRLETRVSQIESYHE